MAWFRVWLRGWLRGCPVKAIYPEEDLPDEWNNFVQVNLDYYKGK